MPPKVLIQINGCDSKRPDPIWSALAAANGIETIWWDQYVHSGKANQDFALVIIQAATTNSIIETMWWHRDIGCPVIGFCGDALVGTNTEVAFRNLEYLSALYVEGYDYWPAYQDWLTRTGRPDRSDRLRFLKTCADYHFPPSPPLGLPKTVDWCFAGTVYDGRLTNLKHYRNWVVKELRQLNPSCTIIGSGWGGHGPVPQASLNNHYAQARVVLCVDAHDGAGYTSTRTMEVMHAGHCALIYRHPGFDLPGPLPGQLPLGQIIQEGVHAYYFDSIREASRKIRAIIDDNTAIGIGSNARELILERGWSHTGWLNKILAEFPTITTAD